MIIVHDAVIIISGQTLRRGAGIIGTALGDFFGVTEVSQRGNTADGRIGWEQYTERRVEEVRQCVCTLEVIIPMLKLSLMVALFDLICKCLNCCHIIGCCIDPE